MNNQDMPANPLPIGAEGRPYIYSSDEEVRPGHAIGEAKREKAFWQVYSAMLSACTDDKYDLCASYALDAVNAGFKALEGTNEEVAKKEKPLDISE